MKKKRILLIGISDKQDDSDLIKATLKSNHLYMDDYQFVSSQETRLTYELIQSTTYFNKLKDAEAIFVYSFRENQERIMELIHSGVDYVAMINRYFTNIHQYKEVINEIHKASCHVKCIVGGSFFLSAFNKLSNERERQYFLNYIGADFYILRYQCEPVIANLLHNGPNNYSLLEDVVFRDGSKYQLTKQTNKEQSLHTLTIDWESYTDSILPVTSLKTTVSCPFNCSFCTVKQRNETYQHRRIDHIEHDLNALKVLNRTSIVYFNDETINLPLTRFHHLLERIISNQYPFTWFSFFRTEYVDDKTAALMKDSRCLAVLLGLECGNNSVLKRMNKNTNMGQMEKAHGILKKHGINTICFFIVGFPGETKETIRQTIDLINRLSPTFYRLHIWECDTGTPVWQTRQEYGLTLKNGMWNHDTMSYQEALEAIDYMKSEIKNSCSIDKADFSFALQLMNQGIPVETIYHIYSQL